MKTDKYQIQLIIPLPLNKLVIAFHSLVRFELTDMPLHLVQNVPIWPEVLTSSFLWVSIPLFQLNSHANRGYQILLEINVNYHFYQCNERTIPSYLFVLSDRKKMSFTTIRLADTITRWIFFPTCLSKGKD